MKQNHKMDASLMNFSHSCPFRQQSLYDWYLVTADVTADVLAGQFGLSQSDTM